MFRHYHRSFAAAPLQLQVRAGLPEVIEVPLPGHLARFSVGAQAAAC